MRLDRDVPEGRVVALFESRQIRARDYPNDSRPTITGRRRRRGERDFPTHHVFSWEIAFDEALVDDHDGVLCEIGAFVKAVASEELHSQRGKDVRRRHVEIHQTFAPRLAYRIAA